MIPCAYEAGNLLQNKDSLKIYQIIHLEPHVVHDARRFVFLATLRNINDMTDIINIGSENIADTFNKIGHSSKKII